MCSKLCLYCLFAVIVLLAAVASEPQFTSSSHEEFRSGRLFVKNPCVSKNNCGECLQTATCAWCSKEVRNCLNHVTKSFISICTHLLFNFLCEKGSSKGVECYPSRACLGNLLLQSNVPKFFPFLAL